MGTVPAGIHMVGIEGRKGGKQKGHTHLARKVDYIAVQKQIVVCAGSYINTKEKLQTRPGVIRT